MNLSFAGDGPSAQQIGYVGAGNEEDERDHQDQDPERLRELAAQAAQAMSSWFEADGRRGVHARWDGDERVNHGRVERREVGLRREAANQFNPPVVGIVELRRHATQRMELAECDFDVGVRSNLVAEELRRCSADDLKIVIVDTDGGADYFGVVAPEALASSSEGSSKRPR